MEHRMNKARPPESPLDVLGFTVNARRDGDLTFETGPRRLVAIEYLPYNYYARMQ